MKIIGINGSLRRHSLNGKLLQAAAACFSEAVSFEVADLMNVPLYNEDLDTDNKPAAVVRLKQQIASADGILFATPEYNYSIPGVLKNAIDWASRPAFDSPLTQKPAAIISASMSPLGGVQAQAALRGVLAGTLSPVLSANNFLLGAAHQAFDDSGQLTDAAATRRLQRYVDGFEQWLNKIA